MLTQHKDKQFMEACFGRAINYTTDNFNDNYNGSEIAYFWVGIDLKSKHLLLLQSYVPTAVTYTNLKKIFNRLYKRGIFTK